MKIYILCPIRSRINQFLYRFSLMFFKHIFLEGRGCPWLWFYKLCLVFLKDTPSFVISGYSYWFLGNHMMLKIEPGAPSCKTCIRGFWALSNSPFVNIFEFKQGREFKKQEHILFILECQVQSPATHGPQRIHGRPYPTLQKRHTT